MDNFAITALTRMISLMFVAPRILLKKVTAHLESGFPESYFYYTKRQITIIKNNN